MVLSGTILLIKQFIRGLGPSSFCSLFWDRRFFLRLRTEKEIQPESSLENTVQSVLRYPWRTEKERRAPPPSHHLVGDTCPHQQGCVGRHSQLQSPETDPGDDMGPKRTGRVKPQMSQWQARVMLLFTNVLCWE